MNYKLRRQNLLNQMKNGSILIVNSEFAPKKTADQQYPFIVNKNFWYLSGIDEDNCSLVLIKSLDGKNTLEILFKQPNNPAMALWVGERIDFKSASKTSKIDQVLDISGLEDFLKSITSGTRTSKYGVLSTIYLDLESDYLYSHSYKLADFVKKELPFLNILNAHPLVANLRMIKDEEEIQKLQRAVDITGEGLKNIRKHIKSGLYEYEVEAEYNYVLKKNNVFTSFDTICGSGHNGTTLHYVKNNQLIEKNSLMVCDLGVEFEGYASDITRTYPVDGKFSPRQKQLYEIVLKANKTSMAMLKPGVTWEEYNKCARDVLIEECKKIGLIKEDKEISKYYYHSVGHFLGLDVHDVGDYSLPLQEGMYLTTEPGLYIAEEGIGIRIEDDVLITKDGHVCLSKHILKEVDEIEALLAERK